MPKSHLATFFSKNLKHIIPGVVLLIFFYTFSFVVKEDYLHGFDFATTVRLQDNITIRFDPYFSSFSLLGSFEVTLGILIVFLLLFRRKVTSIFVVGSFAFMHVVEIIGKAFLDHPGTPY